MGRVRLQIQSAKDLISADSNGASDPYVKIKANNNKEIKTKIIKKHSILHGMRLLKLRLIIQILIKFTLMFLIMIQ